MDETREILEERTEEREDGELFVNDSTNTAASSFRGEELKARERGVDAARCLAQFGDADGPHACAFKAYAAEGVYNPSKAEMFEWQPAIDRLLQSGEVQILIPMHEDGNHDVPAPVLDYLLDDCGIPREMILVVNHLSDESAVQRVVERSVPMVHALDIMDCLDPAVAMLTELPELRMGKGIAVLAGLIALKAMTWNGGPSRFHWLLMHDSELISVRKYNGARYLAYPLVADGDNHNMVLACQSGRNNEAVHAARVAIEADAIFNPVPAIANYARTIGPRLTRLSWMLCGERIVDFRTLCRIPLTTGYCLETMINFGIEGLNTFGNAGKIIGQVVNPEGRIDSCSGEYAEQFMMNMIGRFIRAAVLAGKPTHEWTLEDIGRLNRGFAQMPVVPAIAEFSGPVTCRETPADRVLPSVRDIFVNDWVNREKLAKCLQGMTGSAMMRHPLSSLEDLE